MKKYFILCCFFLTFFGCNKEKSVNEKITLSDTELKSMLINDPNYYYFTRSEMAQLAVIITHLNNLSEDAKRQLDEIYLKYQNAEEFRLTGSVVELAFLKNCFSIENKASVYLSNILKKLDSYNFSRKAFIDILKVSTKTQDSELKTATCEQIYNTVYMNVLYQYWVGANMSFEKAESYAYIDACWAYYGCIKGQAQ